MDQKFDVKHRYRSQSLLVGGEGELPSKSNVDDDFRMKYLQKLEFNHLHEQQHLDSPINASKRGRCQSLYVTPNVYANSQPIKIPEADSSPVTKSHRSKGHFNFSDVDLACSYSVCGRVDTNSMSDGTTDTEEGNDDFIPPHLQVDSDDDDEIDCSFNYY
ncbi:hypothetical protein WA158_000365 [Blastocystis sp. Blastoise]